VALKPCGECGKEISAQAASCPNCGAPQSQNNKSSTGPVNPFGIGCGIVVVLIILVALFGGHSPSGGGSASGGNEVVASLRENREQCRQNFNRLISLGVRVSDKDGFSVAEYDERIWASFEHDDKIRQALLIFCAKMPDDGHYTVLIAGLHDGKTLASVVDGNYMDE
jgi:hypothetical protein